ncbi:MAG: helix-turn-helix domain-containing protein [Christensenellales bacterium]|jgi:predicted transcriptional regulator
MPVLYNQDKYALKSEQTEAVDRMGQHIKADKNVGKNIRKWRNAKGMTQEQLSAHLQVRGCDISRGTLAKIEAGIRHISVEELNAVKAILNIAYDDFFTR